MKPTSGDVHVNTPLTNVSIAYLQKAETFVADKIFPNIPVMKQSDRYYTYDRGYFNRDEMKVRAPSAESAGGYYDVDNTPTYFAPVYAFHHDVDDQRRSNSDAVLDPDREATELCTHKALIKREILWVSKYFVTSVWTTNLTGVSGSPGAGEFKQWNDAASTPIEDIRAQKTVILELTGFEPNTLVIDQHTFDALIDHPDIIDRVKYGQTGPGPAMVDTSELAALLKIPRVFVMKAIKNTANEGATNAHSFIAGKAALLCYAAPAPGLMTPSGGYTFSWTGHLGAAPQGQRIKRFRIEKEASDRIEIEMAFDQKLVSADLGCWFGTTVA